MADDYLDELTHTIVARHDGVIAAQKLTGPSESPLWTADLSSGKRPRFASVVILTDPAIGVAVVEADGKCLVAVRLALC